MGRENSFIGMHFKRHFGLILGKENSKYSISVLFSGRTVTNCKLGVHKPTKNIYKKELRNKLEENAKIHVDTVVWFRTGE